MQVFNVRLGLATNSSSSHSLIFLGDGIEALDYNGLRNHDNEELGQFGWHRFTVVSPAMKLRYLGVMLRDRLVELLPPNVCRIILNDWLDNVEVHENDYIDHQSWYFLPSTFNSKVPDEDFFKALKSYFLQDRLVILGGNDNESARHALDDGTSFDLPLPQDVGTRHCNYVCRHDDQYDFWTLFESKSGSKLRIRLTNDPAHMHVTPQKASAPELVDIKITELCPFGCKFCYQSSTMEGKHAEYYRLLNLAHDLANLKVFEVALGGGEPTLHPDFEGILRGFREVGIVPNFTTRNIAWLRDPKKWKPIMEHCGAFAYSIQHKEEVRELSTLLDLNGIDKSRANVHIVLGTLDQWTFKSLLDACNHEGIRVTLLGYKRFGFGAEFPPRPYRWWIEEVKQRADDQEFRSPISVDTVLAAEYQQEILEAGVPQWLFTIEDGKFSCYIDAVQDKMGPSSFCSEQEMFPLHEEGEHFTPRHERIKQIFSVF